MPNSLLQLQLDKVTYEDVRSFIDERVHEFGGLEYKQPSYNKQNHKFEFGSELLESVVAFANSSSPDLLIIGVADDGKTGFPGEVKGLRLVAKDGDHPRDPEAVLRDQCASEIEPGLSLETSVVAIPAGEPSAGDALLLVRVWPGPLPPYFLRNHGIYVRQDDADRLATVREIEALIDRKRASQPQTTVPWAAARNTAFAYAHSSQPDQPLYLMMCMTPEFPITLVAMNDDTDRRFYRLCQEWFGDDQLVVTLPDGLVYSAGLSPDVEQVEIRTHNYACAYQDGTIAACSLEHEWGNGLPHRLPLPWLWGRLRKRLLAASTWPRETCGYSGILRCQVGLADLSNTIVASLQPMLPKPPPAVLNHQSAWQYEGAWRDAADLEDFIAGAISSLARHLQCRWYGSEQQAVRIAAQHERG